MILPQAMMVGDVTYDAHLLEAGHVPGVGSRRRLREATAMINAMRQRYPGLVILPAHDPGAARRLAQATGQAPTLATGPQGATKSPIVTSSRPRSAVPGG
jgi:glyoxylase-like metal-dependent hydrolase (beta-lactamase superfamily II)